MCVISCDPYVFHREDSKQNAADSLSNSLMQSPQINYNISIPFHTPQRRQAGLTFFLFHNAFPEPP